MPLRDREGMGKRMRREERKRGEGGIDRMRSNNGKQMEKKRKDSTHKGEGSNALYSCSQQRMYMKNEDQVNMTCLLYPSLLKGGPTLKLP